MKKDELWNISKNIFSRLSYVIEFLISVFFIKQSLEILIIKKYNGFYHLNKMILAFILGIILITIIVYLCYKNKNIIEKLFLTFAIPISIGYAILILPFNVPDEGSHIIKAYDISIGNIFTPIDEDGNSYSVILKELEDYSYTRFQHYQNVIDEISKPTDYTDEIKTISAAQGSFPILYIGPILAFNICRIFNINFFIGIYLARLCNIIIFLIFGYFTIKKIPFGKLLMAIYLCMPMMLQQAASCSSDILVNATIIYYIVHLIYMVFKENEITKKDKIILYIFTALVAMFKYVYILVAGIIFVTLLKKENRKENINIIVVMILIGSIFSIGWFMITSQYKTVPPAMQQYNESVNVDSAKQLDYIIHNPKSFVKTFVNEYTTFGTDYIFGAVGNSLGWLNVNVNIGIIVIYIIILLISVISEKSKYEFNVISKIWNIAIILAISAMIKITMYLSFTPVAFYRICGVQGRYFTPILFLAILCIVKKDNYWNIKNVNYKMIIMAFILNIFTLATVFNSYV